MKITWKDVLIALLLILVGTLFWWALSEKKKNTIKDKVIGRLTDENDQLKKSYLDLLQRFLILEGKTPPDVLEELEKLKDKITNLSKKVHIALGTVINLVNDGHYEKAIKDLAKIIENILEERIKSDNTFTKKHSLHNFLEHANERKWITPHEHAYGNLIRVIRNKESHELNVKEEPHIIGLAMFAGIDIIYSLTALKE